MTLPTRCPEHPYAQVTHERRRVTLEGRDGWQTGIEWEYDHSYQCAVCGRALERERRRA